jgi:hypothetical protein
MNHNRRKRTKVVLSSILSPYILRSGFCLLLFGICAVPFALAQRRPITPQPQRQQHEQPVIRPTPRRQLGIDESVTWQNNPVHDGLNSASTLAPPLELKWSRDFSTSGVDTISYPLIAGGMVFVTTANTNGNYGKWFGTILAVQPFNAFPCEGQEIDCKMQSNAR